VVAETLDRLVVGSVFVVGVAESKVDGSESCVAVNNQFFLGLDDGLHLGCLRFNLLVVVGVGLDVEADEVLKLVDLLVKPGLLGEELLLLVFEGLGIRSSNLLLDVEDLVHFLVAVAEFAALGRNEQILGGGEVELEFFGGPRRRVGSFLCLTHFNR